MPTRFIDSAYGNGSEPSKENLLGAACLRSGYLQRARIVDVKEKEPTLSWSWLLLLENALVGKRDVPPIADHDVIEELDAEEFARLLEA